MASNFSSVNTSESEVHWASTRRASFCPNRSAFSLALLTMLAEPDVNPNESLAPTPIAFQIIQMRDSSRLMAADFDQLLGELEPSLGRNYVDHSDYTLVPGQFKFIEPFEIAEDTRFIGVIAFYAYPNLSQWKKVVKVDPIGGRYHLLVNLREREVKLRRSDES